MANAAVAIEDLLERNKAVAKTHETPPHLGSMSKEARPLPATVIVSCADPRCDPSYLFALKPGEAIVFRNMGGRVRSLLGDIVAMDALVGLKHLLVIHHTDCGATFEPAEAVRQGLNKLPGADSDAIQALSLPNYSDGNKTLQDDVEFLKTSTFLRPELAQSVRGFALDIFTGLLEPLV